MIKQVAALAAATALCASTAFAGGLSPEIVESAPAEEAAAPATSINPAFIVVGVVALLLIAANVGDDGDEETRQEKPAQDG